MTKHTIVFDLDGTMIDTAPDLILATNHVLTNAGFAAGSDAALRPVISFGTRAMLSAGIKEQNGAVSEKRLDELFDELIAFYGQNIAVDSRPFPGLTETLDTLKSRGNSVVICTNKREDMARLLMEKLNLTQYFDVITGRDTFPVCKPNPEHLTGAIRLADGDPQYAVMVGDSTTDYETAKAAGIPIIGVTFGYTDIPMAKLECEALVSSYSEFITALDGVLPATA